MNRAVFLDRDGVINRPIIRSGKPYPPLEISQLEILPGVVDAAERLRSANFLLVAITNQPDVARGKASRVAVQAINEAVREKLRLDDVITCFHDDTDQCDCRKPRPGMFFRVRDEYQVDLKRSFMVGDRWRDIQAAHNSGCGSILIDYAYDEPFRAQKPDFTCKSLAEAADYILAISKTELP